MGRIVGDRGFIYFIADIIVHPHHQGAKIGTAIMNEIMAYLNKNAPRNAYITLMSAYGKEGFYEKFGFFKRPDSRYGHGMMISLDNDLPNPPNQKSN
jgi:predicted N-acetyltransferase YhbS